MAEPPRLVQASDIKVIKKITPYIRRFCQKHKSHFSHDDIVGQIKAGNVLLFFCDEGFMVACIKQCQFTNTEYLYIWLMCSFRTKLPLIKTHYQWLVDMVKALKLSRVELDTPHKAFNRLLPKGWKLTSCCYEMSVNE